MRRSTIAIAGLTILAAMTALAIRHGDRPQEGSVSAAAAAPSRVSDPRRPVAAGRLDPPPANEDAVERADNRKFAEWVLAAPPALASDQAGRARLADTQIAAAHALMAYEKAVDRFTDIRGQLAVLNDCQVRTPPWFEVFDERLRAEELQDTTVATLRKALTPVQRDTADAWYAYSVEGYRKFHTTDCNDINAKPFMSRYDAYVKGERSTAR